MIILMEHFKSDAVVFLWFCELLPGLLYLHRHVVYCLSFTLGIFEPVSVCVASINVC